MGMSTRATSPLVLKIWTRGRLPVLREVLDSVFAQTIRFFEAVVVDDASYDGTDDWLAGQIG
jgi:glycosyltransferase involved in cell wall biosynthesis